jgi:hypothetical protein
MLKLKRTVIDTIGVLIEDFIVKSDQKNHFQISELFSHQLNS